ncbi:hypothetical protein KA977_14090, partial [Candidatus Dependentiae bacterium]|nr:hypothetical protein [Candidatus Dependentiae bacterium]
MDSNIINFINQIDVPSCIVRLNGEILSFNMMFKELFFPDFETVNNNILTIFFNKEDYLNIVKNLKNFKKLKKSTIVRYKVIQNDGEEINLFADTYFSVVEYETKPYMLFRFHDVIQLVNNQI